MKAKLLSILTAALAIVAMLGALDLSGLFALYPGDHTATITLISGGLATLGTIVRAIGDLLDDGLVNGSFGKLKLHSLAVLAALILAALASPSCAGLHVSASMPWGDVSTDGHNTYFALRPMIVQEK